MVDDTIGNATIKNNYELLCDYDIALGLTCVLPMMETEQNLFKMAQGIDNDFVTN
jgi:hypothetical protein